MTAPPARVWMGMGAMPRGYKDGETAEARRERMRALGQRGGRATVANHPDGYMSEIARRGFRAAIAAGWGPELARKLGDSYEAKFGRPLDLAAARNAKAAAERRRTRAAHPAPLGTCSCGKPATHRHHIRGLEAGHDDRNIAYKCAACHAALHALMRRGHYQERDEG